MELKYVERFCMNHHAKRVIASSHSNPERGGGNVTCQNYTFRSSRVWIFSRDELTPKPVVFLLYSLSLPNLPTFGYTV